MSFNYIWTIFNKINWYCILNKVSGKISFQRFSLITFNMLYPQGWRSYQWCIMFLEGKVKINFGFDEWWCHWCCWIYLVFMQSLLLLFAFWTLILPAKYYVRWSQKDKNFQDPGLINCCFTMFWEVRWRQWFWVGLSMSCIMLCQTV